LHLILARFALSHTVKELVSRGLKSRSGGFAGFSSQQAPRSTFCLSAALRRGDGRTLGHRRITGQPILTRFFDFFPPAPQSPMEYGNFAAHDLAESLGDTEQMLRKSKIPCSPGSMGADF
jgi:hypothetical protein